MQRIHVLEQSTINKIAAGEVIERPASVVKELLENAIDAKATAVTVEIRDGGSSFIRITDNGSGIMKEDVPQAFLSHATSKIKNADDLFMVASLGFRGEALSSIAAVSKVELITKTPDSLTGIRYQIEGGQEKSIEEIGAPGGTTFIIRDLFFNTPVRKKFLKSDQTEGAHIADLVEKIALSHPGVSIRFIQNNQNKLHTLGNHNVKDMIYTIFGREIAGNLLEVEGTENLIRIHGFAGKPVISRANRNYEHYFINGRYVRDPVIAKAIEEAYRTLMMQHKYPFTLLYLEMEPEFFDINVHPSKLELRFKDGEQVYHAVLEVLKKALTGKEFIPKVTVGKEEKSSKRLIDPGKRVVIPEPFEEKRRENFPVTPPSKPYAEKKETVARVAEAPMPYKANVPVKPITHPVNVPIKPKEETPVAEQLDLFDDKLLETKARERHRLIGQLFDTYWLVEFEEQLFIIDQHAAHEKVLYERTMADLKHKEAVCQMVDPPVIVTLSAQEKLRLEAHLSYFKDMGFEIEPFGDKEYAVRGVPGNLFSIANKDLLIEMIDGLSGDIAAQTPAMIFEKVASMSCKAAVKANQRLSVKEVDALIDQLLGLESPYACPHGRPTIISMSKYELEKKFKRIV